MDYYEIQHLKLLHAMKTLPLGIILNSDGNVSSYRDESGYARLYEYDGNGHLITVIHEDGYSSWFERDSQGNKLRWSNSLGMKTSWVVDDKAA